MKANLTFRDRWLIQCLASGFFSGYLPKAPGTFGTLAAIPPFLLLSAFTSLWTYTAVVLAFVILACFVAAQAERVWNEKDCPKIVIDEWAGFLVTMLGVPPALVTVAAGFLIFRILDIVKPFPVRILERSIPGGAGVVLDDVAAGVYGCILMHLGMLILS